MKKLSNGRKKKMMIIIGSIVLLFFAVILACACRVAYLTTPTKGENIANYDTPKAALVVIDIQNDTLSIPQFKNSKEIISNINNTIDDAKKINMEIIYVKQEYTNAIDSFLSGGMYRSGSNGSELYTDLNVVSNNIFSKYKADAFSNKEFEQFLIDHEIDTLYVVGAEASSCIHKTAIGGINRDYQVVVLESCVFYASDSSFKKVKNEYIAEGIQIEESFSER